MICVSALIEVTVYNASTFGILAKGMVSGESNGNPRPQGEGVAENKRLIA